MVSALTPRQSPQYVRLDPPVTILKGDSQFAGYYEIRSRNYVSVSVVGGIDSDVRSANQRYYSG